MVNEHLRIVIAIVLGHFHKVVHAACAPLHKLISLCVDLEENLQDWQQY